LICLKVVKDLARHGFTLQTIRRCLTPLKEHSSQTERPSESLKYLTDGEEMFIITNDRRKILDAMERQFVVSLGIGNLVRELGGQAKRAALGAGRKRIKKTRRADVKRSGSA
jgi:hypothetical protein